MKAVSKSARVSPEAKRIIKELKSGELEVRNVPEKFALDSNVVKAERKLGLRKSGHRCIFRKNCASVPEERSAIPLQTEQSSAG